MLLALIIPKTIEKYKSHWKLQKPLGDIRWKISYPNTGKYLTFLVNHGAEIDINKLVSELDWGEKLKYLDTLNSHGANIDPNEFVHYLGGCGTELDINQIVSILHPRRVSDDLDKIIAYKPDINLVMSKLSSLSLDNWQIQILIDNNVDAKMLVKKTNPIRLLKNFDLSNRSDIIQEIVAKLKGNEET